MTNEQLKEALYKPLPEESITQHPTKTYLSSIKAVYVTDRFNEVFGIGKWRNKVKTESVDQNTGMVVVHVTFEVPDLGIYYESFGGNDNGGRDNRNFDLGDAYKGATTDALTKIGSFLGVGIDVFKGLVNHNKKPTEPKKDIKEWLTEEQFNKAINSDKKGIVATLNHYDPSKGRSMKKEYRDKLLEKIK